MRSRLYISDACTLILPYHIAVDQAREAQKGAAKIGTTGRGIGPAYEDKVARRALRVQDLFRPELFAEKLKETLAFHNFVLTQYLNAPAVDYPKTLDEAMVFAEQLKPMVKDVSATLHDIQAQGGRLLFEGAQGTLLDVDHGTYPFVTSSNCVAGAAAAGAGVGPTRLNYILGITKAYCTRVGAGPFPTELYNAEGMNDENGKHMAEAGKEFGSVTGRARRCGWFDAAALKRSIQINGVSGLAMMKLDVLDGLPEIKLCVGYEIGGEKRDLLPRGADEVARCTPIYESFPGWTETTYGLTEWDQLPANARAYLERIEQVCGVPIDVVSTGPDRVHTINKSKTLCLS